MPDILKATFWLYPTPYSRDDGERMALHTLPVMVDGATGLFDGSKSFDDMAAGVDDGLA